MAALKNAFKLCLLESILLALFCVYGAIFYIVGAETTMISVHLVSQADSKCPEGYISITCILVRKAESQVSPWDQNLHFNKIH